MMKRFFSLLFILIICAGLVDGVPVKAKNKHTIDKELDGKTKYLEPDATYSYDLDGDGKKEKIRYTCKTSWEDFYTIVRLYINGKKVYAKKIENSFHVAYYLTDLDQSDALLDLFLLFTGENGNLSYASFQQYQDSKIRNLLRLKEDRFGYARITRIDGLAKIDGKGNFSILADSPADFYEMGSYKCYVPFKMKNRKIRYVKTKTYALSDISRKFKYIPNRKIKVYEKADKNSANAFTLSGKDKVSILKIKLGRIIQDERGMERYDGYAYVKINQKEYGWIYFQNEETELIDPMFKETPAWG